MTPQDLSARHGPRESMHCDVLIVGGGPAGLSAAIRLKQRAADANRDLSVVVLEKGADPGAHILSGAVMDPIGLNELIPDWKARGAPLHQAVTEDAVLFLTESSSFRVPDPLLPPNFRNHGNYIISLGNVTRWLATQAEALGVEIFPGFTATEVLYNDDGSVKGVATGNQGIDKHGAPSADFQLGMELLASYTIFAEGARGQLGRELIARFGLDEGRDPQAYGIGIKELWEVDPRRHQPGLVLHTAGWPMDTQTYGGAFLYHLENNRISLGFVVGLDYANPYLSPFEEFQRWKTHPSIRRFLAEDTAQGIQAGKRLSYGARAITAGGLQSLPKTIFPGGALIGCDAGYLNVARIKGSHAAIKTGMLAADAAFNAIADGRKHDALTDYPEAFKRSWLHKELKKSRNFKTWFKKGLLTASIMNGFEQLVLRGNVPWTLRRDKPDHACLRPACEFSPIDYPKPDGKLTFDRLSSVFISNTNHRDDQPVHLTLRDPDTPVAINLSRYAGPEARYCPAGVYEFTDDGNPEGKRLQINAQNCLHCKTCDIKDPTQNIVWVAPEGGGGPGYVDM